MNRSDFQLHTSLLLPFQLLKGKDAAAVGQGGAAGAGDMARMTAKGWVIWGDPGLGVVFATWR